MSFPVDNLEGPETCQVSNTSLRYLFAILENVL
jgi:hypothetical protein